jgi:hypothetical protein
MNLSGFMRTRFFHLIVQSANTKYESESATSGDQYSLSSFISSEASG